MNASIKFIIQKTSENVVSKTVAILLGPNALTTYIGWEIIEEKKTNVQILTQIKVTFIKNKHKYFD